MNDQMDQLRKKYKEVLIPKKLGMIVGRLLAMYQDPEE